MDILSYLNNRKYQNIPAVTAIKRGIAEETYSSEKGVILYIKQYSLYMVTLDDNGVFSKDFIKDENANILVLREHNINLVGSLLGNYNVIPCYQAVYDIKEPLHYDSGNVKIKQLDESFTDIVYDNYSLKLDKDYIRERIESGELWGAFLNGEFAGFAGLHEEGSMGMLEVLPDKRRKGVATALQFYVINKVHERGETPYAHIKVNNQASIALQKNFPSCEILDEKIAWMVKMTPSFEKFINE